MPSDSIIFAGVDISSGRKPVTFAVLDDDLMVKSLEKWDISEALLCLQESENIWLAINVPTREKESHKDFRETVVQAGFRLYSKQNDSKQSLETNAQDCFHALVGQNPLPRRTLGGRLQRALALYEQGLQINDPMEIFEEITRYKLMQGILPFDDIYSSTELDALVSAYLAWMAFNRPGQIVLKGGFVLPAQE
jgi:hypothetical protein